MMPSKSEPIDCLFRESFDDIKSSYDLEGKSEPEFEVPSRDILDRPGVLPLGLPLERVLDLLRARIVLIGGGGGDVCLTGWRWLRGIIR